MASQLDKRYLWFHIDLPPNKNDFIMTYDTEETVRSVKSAIIKSYHDVGSEKASADSHVRQPAHDAMIAWKHYKTNYLTVENDSNLNDDDDDEIDDTDDEILMMPNFLKLNQEPICHFTPWGKIEADNPLSPVHLYDLQVALFRGFSVKTIPNFKALIDEIEGIAMWAILDRYSIVIAPAQTYQSIEVKVNVERAIYQALGLTMGSSVIDEGEYILSIGEQSAELFAEGTENLIVVFPEPNFAVEVIENPNEEDFKQADAMFDQVEDIIIFKNGEFYERSQSDK